MASDGCDRNSRVAHRLAATSSTHDGILGLYRQQCFVDSLGLAWPRLRVDHSANRFIRPEPPWFHKKPAPSSISRTLIHGG